MRRLLCVLVLAWCGIAEAEPDKHSPALVALAADGRYTLLVAALQLTGVDREIAGHDPFTVLAATDEAFAKMDERKRDRLLKNRGLLAAYLRGHILVGSYPPHAIPASVGVMTLAGWKLMLINDANQFRLGPYETKRDHYATSNAVIYSIDRVVFF